MKTSLLDQLLDLLTLACWPKVSQARPLRLILIGPASSSRTVTGRLSTT